MENKLAFTKMATIKGKKEVKCILYGTEKCKLHSCLGCPITLELMKRLRAFEEIYIE